MALFESGTNSGRTSGWWNATRTWLGSVSPQATPRIGVALGGGFARGIAHLGVLRVLDRNNVPISYISGVSSGAIVAAAYASGLSSAEIERVARSMKFSDVARWTINPLGLAGSDRMVGFLTRLLKTGDFENMKIPLAVVATDLCTGKPVVFQHKGEVITPIRASCSFPGLFLPVRFQSKYLVDGFVSMEVPALPLRRMGATHVISVSIPNEKESVDPGNLFSVLNRCFQVMTDRLQGEWRRHSTLVIEPDVTGVAWDSFGSATELMKIGEAAAIAAMPSIERWLNRPAVTPQPSPTRPTRALTPVLD